MTNAERLHNVVDSALKIIDRVPSAGLQVNDAKGFFFAIKRIVREGVESRPGWRQLAHRRSIRFLPDDQFAGT